MYLSFIFFPFFSLLNFFLSLFIFFFFNDTATTEIYTLSLHDALPIYFGIMDMCGFPKNIYYYYQSWWTDHDVLHISPHWNWRDKRNQPIDVWVNTNADDVELFLNGKSLGKKDMARNSHLKWTVNYQPGTLEAVAYK